MSLSLNEMASIVSNRMYGFGETYAQAKAWVLANLSTSSSADGTSLDAVQTAITTLGGEALASRSASWYVRASLYSELPASSANPVQPPGFNLAGNEGNVLTVTNGAWALGAGGGGSLTVGAFGSTPNANGASASGSTLTLQPADGTHPGLLSTAAQTIGGAKTFSADLYASSDGIRLTGSAGPFSYAGMAFPGGGGSTNTGVFHSAGTLVLSAYDGSVMNFYVGAALPLAMGATQWDGTGMGAGGSIKLKSPDGTTYTLSIANGGTVHIV